MISLPKITVMGRRPEEIRKRPGIAEDSSRPAVRYERVERGKVSEGESGSERLGDALFDSDSGEDLAKVIRSYYIPDPSVVGVIRFSTPRYCHAC